MISLFVIESIDPADKPWDEEKVENSVNLMAQEYIQGLIMPSFDIVSKINAAELKNAVDNAIREINTRFDFRGVVATIELQDLTVTLKSASDFQVRQLEELFGNHCTKRGISTFGIEKDDEPTHSGKTYFLTMTFKQGIDHPAAKAIIKLIKASKAKVQAAIQEDKIRITGKKRDDLQEVIALLKKSDLKLSLQFENFRD